MNNEVETLKFEIAKRDAILLEMGITFDDVEDMYSDVAVHASRYLWLRDRLSVEDLPEEHPAWSVPSEFESVKVDKEIDKRIEESEA
jgi:hypothetical protein